MAADVSRGSSPPDGAPPSEEVAANLGAMVGEQVRRLIESAERSAAELHRQAVDDVSSDHEAVQHTAILVQERIDVLEASVGQLLQQIREEVRQIADDAGRASRSPRQPQPAIKEHAERLPADEPHAEVQEEVPPVDRPAEPTAEDDEADEDDATGPAEDVAADAPPAAEDVAADAPPAAEDVAADAPPAAEDVAADAPPAAEDVAADAPPAAEDVAADAPPAAEDVAADAPPAAEDVAADAPPAAEEPSPAPKPVPAAQRRGGLFRLLQRREPTLGCAICGRTPEAGANSREIKRWHATGDVTLCPDCQAEGWR